MRLSRAVFCVLASASVLISAGCAAKSSSTAKPQTATVQRGAIAVSTTSAGNLAFTRTEDVAFDMAGTVQNVNVTVGDSVTEGEVLATLDASVWDDQIKTLQQAVTTAQRNLTSAERQISSQQLQVTSAQLNLQTAQNVMASIPAVKAAQDLVDNAQSALTAAKGMYTADPNLAGPQIAAIQQQLTQAQKNLQSVVNGTSFNLSSDISLQITKAQFSVQQSQFALDGANIAVDNAKQARDDANQTLQNAQSALADAQSLSPEVKAPFAGFVTTVGVQGGQDVKKGAVAAVVADPTQFEAAIPIGEKDALNLRVGGLATVSVNAMTGVTLPARIISISPTATIQQGVVNYQVTVQITSFVPTSGNFTTGQRTFPGGLGSGNQTIQGQRPQTTGTPGGGQTPPQFTGTPGQRPTGPSGSVGQSASGQPVTLKQGLSVTVTVVTSQVTNVLMVPNRAIIRQSGKTYVNVEKSGTTTEVVVTTGMSNTQYTEITSGLNDGDTVAIPTSTISPTTTPRPGGGGIGFPGIGG